MPVYRLLSTRRNRDGSFDVPSLDVPIEALDDEAAIVLARRFPLGAYDRFDVAWVADRDGRVIWQWTESYAQAA